MLNKMKSASGGKTQIALGIAALALGLVAVKSFTPVLAYRGDATVKGPYYTEERHNINVTAFEKADYQSWVANMAGRGATRFVNESNFKEFAAAQLAAQKVILLYSTPSVPNTAWVRVMVRVVAWASTPISNL